MKKDLSYLLDSNERCKFIRKAASEGFVLLKNEDATLPVKDSDKIVFFGRTQIDTYKGGTGSANSSTKYSVNIIDGIKNSNINFDRELAEKYSDWSNNNPIPQYGAWGSGMHSNPEMVITSDDVKGAFDRGANKVVIVIGRSCGENEDIILTKGDFYLSDIEENIFKEVSKYFSDIIVILNTTGIIDLSFIDKYPVKSLLLANSPGMEAGNSIADVLSGAVTPSGKLTDTVAFDYSDYPSSKYFGQNNGGILQDYVEDIYVGYRYFESFEGMDKKVRFPFGFGLSYTEFKMSDFSFKENEQEIEISLKITNIGSQKGKEVAQLYFAPPQPNCEGVKLYKPFYNLCAFKKTSLLDAGESECTTLTVKKDDLTSFDDTGITGNKNCKVLEAGEYSFYLGNSITDAKANKVGSFSLDTLKVVEQCHAIETALSHRLIGDGSLEALDTIPIDVLEGIRIGLKPEKIDPTLFAKCDGDFTSLKKGNSLEYRLLLCASGGYKLTLNIGKKFSGINAVKAFSITVNDSKINLEDIKIASNGVAVIENLVFPIGKSKLEIEILADYVTINEIIFEKINHLGEIKEAGESIIEAENFFECAYLVGGASFIDTQGKMGGYLNNMRAPGRFVTYKLNTEVAGIYDLSFMYSNSGDPLSINQILAVFVSNVEQGVDNIIFENTCNKGEFNFKLSKSIQIALPHGESYLKIVTASSLFPDLDFIVFNKSEKQGIDTAGSSREVTTVSQDDFGPESTEIIVEPEFEEKGIQLYEVYDNPELMPDFLNQLSNKEVAFLTSGSPVNRTSTGTTGTTPAIYERSIVPVQTADGPLGLRLRATTLALPSGTVIACSWNPEIAYEMGAVLGYEAIDHDVDCVLGPGLNIHRDIRAGRNFEYYSEDPYIAGVFAAEAVKGIQSVGVLAMAKHYAANNCEHERLKSNSRVSARALREIYLKGFEIAVKTANPASIMTCYNHVNNKKACENYTLITEIPREEWGFEGIFATDWINDSDNLSEVKAGHTLKMSIGEPDSVFKALEDGTLSREFVLKNVEKLLNFIMKSRYFRKKFHKN